MLPFIEKAASKTFNDFILIHTMTKITGIIRRGDQQRKNYSG